jgi:hypothetical protein
LYDQDKYDVMAHAWDFLKMTWIKSMQNDEVSSENQTMEKL